MSYLTRQVTKGFQDRGPLLVSQDKADAALTVSLRSFRWDIQMGC